MGYILNLISSVAMFITLTQSLFIALHTDMGNPYNKEPCLFFLVVKPKSNDVITLGNHTDNTSNITTKCIYMLYHRSIFIACYYGGLCYHTSAYLRVINNFLALNHDAKYCSKHTEM